MKTMVKLLTAAVAPILSALLFGRRTFNRLVRRDVEALLAESHNERPEVVTEAMLESLPEPVRRYLHYTGVVGTPLVRTVHLKQKGTMHPGVKGPRIPLKAEQWYAVQLPGFVWDGTMHLGPLPLARARDKYHNGRGNMLVKAGSLLTVVAARGKEMDQGAMMRYLSEMIWFPSAFLSSNISFESVDQTSARVTLTDHGRSATGTMYFDEEGRLIEFVAKRYRMVDGGYELCTWSNPVMEYGERAGLKLPVRGVAVWHLEDGDLAYIDMAITELEYDVSGDTEIKRVAQRRWWANGLRSLSSGPGLREDALRSEWRARGRCPAAQCQ